jgi:hypothetical protein
MRNSPFNEIFEATPLKKKWQEIVPLYPEKAETQNMRLSFNLLARPGGDENLQQCINAALYGEKMPSSVCRVVRGDGGAYFFILVTYFCGLLPLALLLYLRIVS